MRIDFCLPIRNEEEVLEANVMKLVAQLEKAELDFTWKIIGAVNGSNDNSVGILEKLKNIFPDKIDYLKIERPGKGGAIKLCWRKSEADILAFMDADLAVSLEATEKLISPIINREADLVISSRFMPGASAKRSLQRGLISKGYVALSRFVLNHNKQDIQCGFKAISRAAFNKIEMFLKDDYWFFDTELVILAEVAHLKTLEIAVDWSENRIGNKKSNIKIFSDSFDFIKKLFYFRLRLSKIKKYFYNV